MLGLVVVFALQVAGPRFSADRCVAAVDSTSHWRRSTSQLPGEPRIWQLVDSVLMNEAVVRRRGGVRASLLTAALPDTAWLLPLRAELQSGGTGVRTAMEWALAAAIRGEQASFSWDQAALAALAYADLRLSTRPVASVLGDPGAGSISRLLAMRAISDRYDDSEILLPLTAAMCILTAQAEAMRPYRSAQSEPQLSLAEMDDDLFSFLIFFNSVRRDRGLTHVRWRDYVPEGNPLAADIRRFYPRDWGSR